MNLKQYLIAIPLVVLLFTRGVIELSTRMLPSHLSWLPAFAGYYVAISIALYIGRRFYNISIKTAFNFSFTPRPRFIHLFWLIAVPALLPLSAFILNFKYVTPVFLLYIILFALINPIFEEGFWRGLLLLIPGNKVFRVLYTATLFAFSHYFLWGYWFKSVWVTGPAVLSTFIMGILWMLFMDKYRKINYPILSHIVVDILNLSVAVYYGMVTFGH